MKIRLSHYAQDDQPIIQHGIDTFVNQHRYAYIYVHAYITTLQKTLILIAAQLQQQRLPQIIQYTIDSIQFLSNIDHHDGTVINQACSIVG